MNQPVPCIVIDGTPICIVCWELLGAEFARFTIGQLKAIWQRIDTDNALKTAAALTGGARP